jgi:hypothetical protein
MDSLFEAEMFIWYPLVLTTRATSGLPNQGIWWPLCDIGGVPWFTEMMSVQQRHLLGVRTVAADFIEDMNGFKSAPSTPKVRKGESRSIVLRALHAVVFTRHRESVWQMFRRRVRNQAFLHVAFLKPKGRCKSTP